MNCSLMCRKVEWNEIHVDTIFEGKKEKKKRAIMKKFSRINSNNVIVALL